MKNRILLVLLCLVVAQSAVFALDKECIIYNKKYKNHHIYASSDVTKNAKKPDELERIIVSNIAGTKKTNQFFDSDAASLWTLGLVDEKVVGNNVFYLRSVKYPKEYLYASRNRHRGKERRRVFARKMGNDSDGFRHQQFAWSFEETDKKGHYHIYNSRFKEPLYEATMSRQIFTWHDEPDSDQFAFAVVCRHGLLELD